MDTGSSDKVFYEKLYKQNQHFIRAIAQKRLSDKNRAEDVVQETFLLALERLAVLQAHENRCGWLVRTAVNIVRQHNRKQSKSKEILCADITTIDDRPPEKTPDDGIFEILSELDPGDREIITLFYKKEMSVREIAKVLKIKESAVKNKLSRARKRLKKHLVDKDQGDLFPFT